MKFPQTRLRSPTSLRPPKSGQLAFAMDHVAGANLERRANWEGRETLVDFHEPFVLFGYLAGVTQRLEFFTSVLVLPQRQTVLVAKQAAEIDLLSRGRLRLGVGVGWAEPEVPGAERGLSEMRGASMEEHIAVLSSLFTNLTF